MKSFREHMNEMSHTNEVRFFHIKAKDLKSVKSLFKELRIGSNYYAVCGSSTGSDTIVAAFITDMILNQIKEILSNRGVEVK